MKKYLFLGIITLLSIKLHSQTTCNCFGKGEETLVFEAGMGGWSLMFKPLSEYLKDKYRICLIDRDGYKSSLKSTSRDSKTIAIEIYQALQDQGIKDSVIMIGHSFGGLNVRVFQSLFPGSVKAIILIDATHPEQFLRLPREFKALKEKQPKQMQKVEKIAKWGLVRLSKKSIPTFGMPENYLSGYHRITTRSYYYNTYYYEIMSFDESMQQVADIKNQIKIPLLVLSASNSMDSQSMPEKNTDYPFVKHNKIWQELQKEFLQISSNSVWQKIQGNHYFFLTKTKETAQIISHFIDNM